LVELTPERCEAAKAILEKYRRQLHATGSLSQPALFSFHKELRECWDVSYPEMKRIITELAKTPDNRYLAAYYMEYSNGHGFAVAEYQPTLAELYGIESYRSEDKAARERDFWQSMPRQ
jgi:hypothetical protein